MKHASAQYPFAAIVSIVVASLLCLWGSFESYNLESTYQQQHSDPYLANQFARFEPLLSAVPERAELGYLTDTRPGAPAGPAMLLSAQYVLAPRLLEKGTQQEWVLGNFTRPDDFTALGQSYGLRLQQDFGNGVVLFGKDH
jgi:hypothetical protein